MTDEELVETWLNAQTVNGLSPLTVKRRRLSLVRFVAWLAAHDTRVADATANQVEAWLASLKVQPQSRGLYLGDLRVFYRWAARHDHLELDPTVKVDAPKRPSYQPNPIPRPQLLDAIREAPNDRVRTMLTLAGYAGLRAAEIAGLRAEHFDHDANNLRVTGKGGKTRIVPMSPAVAALVQPGDRGPVISWGGKPITPAAVSAALSRYLREVRHLDHTGHHGRHSFGTTYYAESHDLLSTANVMGHSSTITTQGYVAHDATVARETIARFELP
jgi:integrase/recombinase XerC